MKANELMIGDWIIIDDVPTKVVSIYEHSYHYRVNDDTNYVDNCKPILLTEEILDANRFTDCKVIGHEDVCIRNQNGWKYVHELQHALRLCGLYELADNFKLKEE